MISLIIYVTRISKTIIPPGSTPQQIEQMTQKYGLDRPVIEQYGWFLFTLLPGLTLLGLYGTIGQQRRDFQQGFLAKILIILLLVTNIVTMLISLVTAHASADTAIVAFWLGLADAGLALANFFFLLVIWNGYKWGVWAFGIASFVLCTLKFVGYLPIFPILFELSSVIVLIYLIRYSWPWME